MEKIHPEQSQKVVIASSGKSLDSQVDRRFGRCPYFIIADVDSGRFEAVENTAGQAFRGAGVSAAQMVVNKKVKAVIAGNFGPNAVNVLSSSGIEIYGGVFQVAVREALEQYKKGELKETTAVTTPFGMGRGRGMGRCFGQGSSANSGRKRQQ